VVREVLDALKEEAAPLGGGAGAAGRGGGSRGGGGGGTSRGSDAGAGAARRGGPPLEPWASLAARIEAGERSRAEYFRTAPNPYGSEFAYDTTGQEEVVVWLLYFGHDAAAERTVKHVQQYMRPLPNWAYNGGAEAGDVANGGE